MKMPLMKPALRICCMIFSFIIYALTILAAYGGRFDTDIFTFPAMLTLVMPWLALITLILTIIWVCLKKIIPATIGVLTILISWGPISTASPLGFSKKPEPGAKTFTIMSYNMIHGWDQENKSEGATRNRTIDYILETDADIVCCIELLNLKPGGDVPHLSEKQYAELRQKYPYIVGDTTLDMKLLSKYPATFEHGYNCVARQYDRKRYTFYKINIDGQPLTVVMVHLMSFKLSDKERKIVTEIKSVETAKESYNELKTDIRKKMSNGFARRKEDAQILRETIDHIHGPLIICGDFNDVPESYAYRLLRGNDLKDAYVETGFGPLVTYNQHAFWFHLDQILYRGDLRALSVKKGNTRLSDHYPLIAEFEIFKSTPTLQPSMSQNN